MSDSEWTPKTLKEHFDQMLSDRDRAVTVAIAELERRLSSLNNAHEAARQKDRDFFSRDSHDVYATQVSEKFASTQREIIALEKPKWQIWIAAGVLTIGIIAGQWSLAITPYADRLRKVEDLQNARISEHLGDRLRAAEEKIKEQDVEHGSIKKLIDVVNSRIDRLYELYRDLNAFKKSEPPKRLP